MSTASDRISFCFADVLLEAQEFIEKGEMTCDEVVSCFAEALTGSHQYFQETADIYEKLINAVVSRYRNK